MPAMRMKRGFSSHDIRKLWRYAIDKDFHAIDQDIETDEKIMGYGSEERFIPFDHPINKSWFTHSTNADGTSLAIPDGNNVDVYHLDTGVRTVLYGHTSDVTTVGFSPTDPNLLVSASESMRGPTNDSSGCNDIILWDLRQATKQFPEPVPIEQATEAGVLAIHARLRNTLTLSDHELGEIRGSVKSMIERFHTRSRVPASSRVNGRISTTFQSPLFSNSGDFLIYLPGDRPSSNGDDTWDICLYDIANRVATTLSGHRDSIMWIGFSPDDTSIASAGWDGTFRVHDLTGKQLWKWETDRQNWAAVFSPSGEYLAGTDGAGVVRVWNLKTGEETAKIENGDGWCRAIDWSPDGKHIIVGSEDWGRLALYAVTNGKLGLTQERKLSAGKCNLESIDPPMRRMLGRLLGVHTAQFLTSPHGQTSTRLVSSVSVDDGIEVFDFDKGKKWRFVPKRDADGSAIMTKAGDGDQGLVGHVWRKERGEIGVIAPDGVRFWHLD
jgi:WD40 repeat protein